MQEYSLEEIREYAKKVRERADVVTKAALEKLVAMNEQLIEEVETMRASVYRVYKAGRARPALETCDLSALHTCLVKSGTVPSVVEIIISRQFRHLRLNLVQNMPGLPSDIVVTRNLEIDPRPKITSGRRAYHDCIYVVDLMTREVVEYSSVFAITQALRVTAPVVNRAIRIRRPFCDGRYCATTSMKDATAMLGAYPEPMGRSTRRVVCILVRRKGSMQVLHKFKSTREFADHFGIDKTTARNAVSGSDGNVYKRVPNNHGYLFLAEFVG